MTLGAIASNLAISASPTIMPSTKKQFEDLYKEFSKHMQHLVNISKAEVDGFKLIRPCSSKWYNGLWHDDFTWPMIGFPELQKGPELQDAVKFVTRASINLHVVPDRIEYDGTPIMSPGGGNDRPMSEEMPLHLPSAWVRLLSHAEAAGCEIPRKDEWAQLIKRSYDQVPLAFDLVYNNPQKNIVGFGFMDSIRLTGLVLMTSLVTIRGLERSAELFKENLDLSITDGWRIQATKMRSAITRLFDEQVGGFVGGSRHGKAFSVWGNGLGWSLASKDQQKVIAKTLTDQWNHIFLQGCTRQTPGPTGWPETKRATTYQNGGYWGTGTGFVLPAIADFDPNLALKLTKELLENLKTFQYAEYIEQDGKPGGPKDFLGTVAMPMMGLRSIIEQKPLLSYM